MQIPRTSLKHKPQAKNPKGVLIANSKRFRACVWLCFVFVAAYGALWRLLKAKDAAPLLETALQKL